MVGVQLGKRQLWDQLLAGLELSGNGTTSEG